MNETAFASKDTSPAAEAVDHLHFQISLLRLCAVPDLATSVKPGWVAVAENEAPETRQTLELEFLAEVAR